MLLIGRWTFDPQTDTLVSGEERRKLEPRSTDVLMALARNPGQVIHKDALIAEVWGRLAVSDHSVAIVISDLRRALGDDTRKPAYIETIAKRGYRLIAPVETVEPVDTPASARAGSGTGTAAPTRRRALAGGLAAAAAAAGLIGVFAAHRSGRASGGPDPQTAFVDVVNATGDPARDLEAYALNELISDALSRSSPRGVMRWRAGGSPDPAAVEALGRDGRIVSGRLFQAGAGTMISLQISAPEASRVVWSRVYPLPGASLMRRAQTLNADLAQALGRRLPPVPGRPVPPEAWEMYWRGRALFDRRDETGPAAAAAILNQAVRRYPDFVQARAALADVYAHKTGEHLDMPRADTFALARVQLAEARRLGGSSETEVTEALVSFYGDRRPRRALSALDRALERNPANALAWQTRAMVLSAIGEDRKAIAAIDRARRLDPSSFSVLWDRVWFLYLAGRWREALAAAEAAARVTRPHRAYTALIRQALGQERQALTAWVDRAEAKGVTPRAGAKLRGLSGWQAYDALIAAQAEAGLADTGVVLAVQLLNAGRRADAEAALKAAPPARDGWMILWADRIPALAPLRTPART